MEVKRWKAIDAKELCALCELAFDRIEVEGSEVREIYLTLPTGTPLKISRSFYGSALQLSIPEPPPVVEKIRLSGVLNGALPISQDYDDEESLGAALGKLGDGREPFGKDALRKRAEELGLGISRVKVPADSETAARQAKAEALDEAIPF